jgi:hypothetical protein
MINLSEVVTAVAIPLESLARTPVAALAAAVQVH